MSDAALAAFSASLSFTKLVGLTLVRAEKAGVSAALLVGAIGAFLNLPEGSKGTTRTKNKTNLIAAAPAGAVLTATAEPVSVGLWLYPARGVRRKF